MPETATVDNQTPGKRVGSGLAGPGRPKGSVNKVTAAAKDVIAQAAAELGGKDRLVSWVREDALNERAFWATIYPKLLPLQVAGDPNAPLAIEFRTIYESKP
jgi:hypothetical protein